MWLSPTILQRLWRRSHVAGACWIWDGSTNGKYGHIRPGGLATQEYVHRVSFLYHNGYLTDELNVLHECDTPLCWRPEHLFEGTARDNTEDMLNKGRASCGESRYNAKLTEHDVKRIRTLHAAKRHDQYDLSVMFGVPQPQISLIVRRRVWKHVG